MIYRIAWWAGIAAGLAGVVAAYNAQWPASVGLGLLAVVGAAEVKPVGVPDRAGILDVPLDTRLASS